MSRSEQPTERDLRVADAVRRTAADEFAPPGLRVGIESIRASGSRGQRWRWWARPASGLQRAIAGAVAAAAIAVGVIAGAGGFAGAAGPTIAQIAAVATAGPNASAPAVSPGDTNRLDVAVGRLHFPNWRSEGGWAATGQRVDAIDGRTVRTVFYTRDGRRLAYSIVDTPILNGTPAGGSGGGETYLTVHREDRTAVVWSVDGHTCVLSGNGVTPSQLWSLASSTTEA